MDKHRIVLASGAQPSHSRLEWFGLRDPGYKAPGYCRGVPQGLGRLTPPRCLSRKSKVPEALIVWGPLKNSI